MSSNKDLIKYSKLVEEYQQALKEGKTEQAEELNEQIALLSLKPVEQQRFFRSY